MHKEYLDKWEELLKMASITVEHPEAQAFLDGIKEASRRQIAAIEVHREAHLLALKEKKNSEST